MSWSEKWGLQLREDAQGCLYETRLRELMGMVPGIEPADVPSIEAMAALRLAGHELHQLTERWAERYGLSEGRLQVLLLLWRAPGHHMPLGALAESRHVSARNVTGLVDQLEADGLVQRVPDADDRRSVQAQLTEAGRSKIEGVWGEALRNRISLVRGFSPAELVQLRHLCLRLVATSAELHARRGREAEAGRSQDS